MAHVLFITSRLPFPPSDGRRIGLYTSIRYMAQDLKCKVTVASFLDSNEEVTSVPGFISDVVLLRRPSLIRSGFKAGINLILHRGDPAQAVLYFSPTNVKILKNYIKKNNIDTVVFDMVRTATYVESLRSPGLRLIVDLDDLLSRRYMRQVSAGSEHPIGSAGGAFLKPIATLLSALRIGRWVTSTEAILLDAFEKRLVSLSDSVVLISKVESEELKKKVTSQLRERIWNITSGIDVDYFQNNRRIPLANVVSFLGSLNVPHNISGLTYFIQRIWPQVVDMQPEAVLRVIGRNATPEIRALCESCSSIQLIGEVADHRPWLSESTVFVAPMLFGSGVKTKILEALGAGVPVVTSSIGAEGISDYEENCPIIIVDDEALFAKSVVRILKNQVRRGELSAQGEQFVKRHFDRRRNLARWSNLLELGEKQSVSRVF